MDSEEQVNSIGEARQFVATKIKERLNDAEFYGFETAARNFFEDMAVFAGMDIEELVQKLDF